MNSISIRAGNRALRIRGERIQLTRHNCPRTHYLAPSTVILYSGAAADAPPSVMAIAASILRSATQDLLVQTCLSGGLEVDDA